MYKLMFDAFKNEVTAATAAKTAADQQCGNRFNDIINNLKTRIFATGTDLSSIAERILEYDLVSMSAAAGALIPIKEKEFSKIDFVQDSILDCLHNYRQVQIVGGAGTGKTFIGIKKAVQDALNEKRVLFTCCNEELAAFVKSKVAHYSKIDVYTYAELMQSLLGEQYETLPVNSNGNKCCFEYMDDVPNDAKYDSIVVDEAQDFDIDMGLAIRSLLINDSDSSLYVFYDKNQNVFEMDFENAFAIDAPPYVLRYNIRNTGSIYQCAVERTNLGHDTVANSIVGVHPEIHNYSKPSQAVKALSLIVNRLVQKEYVSEESIVIVSDVPYANSILAGEQRIGAYNLVFKHYKDVAENEICFKTAEEFKGLESDVVYKDILDIVAESEVQQNYIFKNFAEFFGRDGVSDLLKRLVISDFAVDKQLSKWDMISKKEGIGYIDFELIRVYRRFVDLDVLSKDEHDIAQKYILEMDMTEMASILATHIEKFESLLLSAVDTEKGQAVLKKVTKTITKNIQIKLENFLGEK